MKLTRIELGNLRCFRKATFDLMHPSGDRPLDVALLVGPNGSGKSALLRALARFFTHLVGTYDGGAFDLSDIRHGELAATMSVHLQDTLDDGTRTTLDLQGMLTRVPVAVQIRQDDPRRHFIVDHDPMQELLWRADPARQVERTLGQGFHLVDVAPGAVRWRDAVLASSGSAGLIMAFGSHRVMTSTQIPGPRRDGVLTHRAAHALRPLSGTPDALASRARDLAQWIVNLDFLRARARADRGVSAPLWSALQTGLDKLLAPYTFEGIDDDFRILFRTPHGTVPLDDLSQGFASVFLIVAELLLRGSLAASKPTDIFQQEAVCLVDEIEAHLHPRWQETVISGLRALFPRLQLIATTHSPFVVASVEPCNVFRLDESSS
ncbi:AAA family ATPase [Chondromyces apiculatus]|uniref:AAA+ ATPase domain-containing protein n=1 Tax=Chondromyces apiculatus DSM 436 TaxID=1192034 RepID=A0A017T8I6_9BACT|nr:AAA family ATPase [Chondromyces apiculatus]EYF05297.1 Hypothetical protein CAP_3438 [Chondromyces apiculatus DSM 436]